MKTVFGNIKFEKTQAVEIWLAFLYVENVDYKERNTPVGNLKIETDVFVG